MRDLLRFLQSGGNAGEVPDWYRILKAAQYLGTTPWELEGVPWRYILQAEAAQGAEAKARPAATT